MDQDEINDLRPRHRGTGHFGPRLHSNAPAAPATPSGRFLVFFDDCEAIRKPPGRFMVFWARINQCLAAVGSREANWGDVHDIWHEWGVRATPPENTGFHAGEAAVHIRRVRGEID